MSNFKVGDVVKLKSGSPAMTVSKADGHLGLVTCVWFQTDEVGDYVGALQTLSVVPGTLNKVEED